MSLLVQTETSPYQYVSVEGAARLDAGTDITELERSLAIRYLGEKRGLAYFESTEDQRAESVLVILTPERWLTVDYAKEDGAGDE